jgi:hypothetical protein
MRDNTMNIDEFNVSERCRYELKRVGVTTVEDIVEFLEGQADGPAMIRAGWLKHFEEIVNELKSLNLWSETLENTWPNDLFSSST